MSPDEIRNKYKIPEDTSIDQYINDIKVELEAAHKERKKTFAERLEFYFASKIFKETARVRHIFISESLHRIFNENKTLQRNQFAMAVMLLIIWITLLISEFGKL